MRPSGTYTCTDYRQEMILLGLKRQLADTRLPEADKHLITRKIRELEQQMGMD